MKASLLLFSTNIYTVGEFLWDDMDYISDVSDLDSWYTKLKDESFLSIGSPVPLMCYDLSDLASLILSRIISMECTLYSAAPLCLLS